MTRSTWWLLATMIAALALAASANSVGNGFTYDDVYLIERAPRMHTLAGWWREFAHTYWAESAGGDGYRPFTIIAYRLQWALGNGGPLPFHATNIALHVAGSVAVFWLVCALLPVGAAWIGAALYAVHPVHVEAIANVVGQSELAVALLLALAAGLYLHGRRAGPITRPRWVAIALLYAAGCLFKEHAIVLPALLILAELTVVVDKAPLPQRLVAMRPACLGLAAIGVAYLWARSAVVLEGLGGFNPFVVFQSLQLSSQDRVLTMIGATPEWLRLFLWPARLTTEYAPPYLEVAQGVSIAQLPGLLVLLGTLGLAVACWRRSPATSFGIGWLALTLLPASNFIIPAGFIIAERTLLSPSIGAMVAVASAVPVLYERIEANAFARRAGATAVLLLLALGIGRSVSRNRAWHDNETLFRQGIVETPDSYRAHFMLGLQLFETGRLTEGERHFREALRLFPYDALMFFTLAERYRGAGKCEPAINLYRAMFALQPDASWGRLGFANCLLVTFHLDDARHEALAAMRHGGNVSKARAIMVAAREAAESLAVRRARGDTSAPTPIRLPPP
jgi:tetratricopeptide (TPR) repeat protein